MSTAIDSSTASAGAPRAVHDQHTKSLRAHSTWRGQCRTDIAIRQFRSATGEPVKAGGDNSAPTPMELILGGLQGCLTVVVETVAGERGISVTALEIDAHAVIDVRGFEGVVGIRPFYETVDLTVDLDADLPEQDLPAFADEAERRCPALTLIRAAGVDATVQWVLR